MSDFNITKVQVAMLLGVEERSITRFQKDINHPLPIKTDEKRGKSNVYDANDILKWAIAKELRKVTISGDGVLIDYDVEKARLTKEQADSVAIKNEEARRNLIPRAVLEWALEDVASQIASILDSVRHEIKKRDKSISTRALDIVDASLAKGRNIAVRIKPDYSKLEGND